LSNLSKTAILFKGEEGGSMHRFGTPQRASMLAGALALLITVGALFFLPVSHHFRRHGLYLGLPASIYLCVLYLLSGRPIAKRLRYLTSITSISLITIAFYVLKKDLPILFLLYLFVIIYDSLVWDQRTAAFTTTLSLLGYAATAFAPSPTVNSLLGLVFIGFIFISTLIISGSLLGQQRLRTKQLAALNAIAQTVSQSLDLDSILSAALDKVLETLEFESGAIYVKDIETSELEMKQHRGLSEEFRRAVTKGIISARVADSGKPIVIDDLSQEPSAPRVVVEEGYRPLASIPLLSKGQVQGVLIIASRQLRRFRQQDVDLLLAIGNQIGIAIENARLYEETRRRMSELAALQEVSLQVTSSLDLTKVLESIAESALKLVEATDAHIFFYDEEEGEFRFGTAVWSNGKKGKVAATPRKDGVTATVARQGEPLVINDAETHLLFTSQEAREWKVKAIAGFPLKRAGKVLGVLNVAFLEPHTFDDRELRILALLADQAAIAIENARLFEEEQSKREEAETLRQAAQALSATLDLQQVFESILSELQKVVPYDSASVQLLKGDRLEIIGGHGFPNLDALLGISFPLQGDNPNRQVMARRAPFIVEDAPTVYSGFRQEPHAPAGIRAWLGVPLLFGDRLIGMIALDKRVPGFYTEEHARLALAFAAQAAIAIENARLYEEEQKRLKEITALHEVSEVINSTLDLREVFQRVVEELFETFGYRLVDIYLLEEEGLRLQAQVGYDAETIIELIPLDQGVTGRVARTGQPALVPDVSQDPDYIPAYPQIKSEICVPVKSGETLLGTLNVECDEKRPLTDDDLQLLSTLSSHIGVAIENARLFEKEQRLSTQRKTIAEVGRTAAAILDMDTLLSRVVHLIAQGFGYYRVHIFQVDQDSGHAVYRVGTGEAALTIAEEGLRLKIGEEGLVGWVARHGEPLLVNNVSQDPRYYSHPELPDTRSELDAPIRIGERIIGVLDVQSTELDAFEEGDLETLQTLADQLAVAMENACLYEETQRLAITDGLTGLYNLRYFYETLEREIQRSERYHRSVSLIMLDIDGFKAYNDLYGHLAGDALLIELAQLMSKVTRRTDTLARYGGEEFAIILPETETEGARFLAERLLEEVRKHRFSMQDSQTIGRITISLGVATYPHHADSAKTLVHAADKALLRAKQAGKNRLSVCGEELTEPEPR